MNKALRPLLRPDGAGSHAKLGYMIDGSHAGPTLLIPMPRAQATQVADAFRQIPRLGDMRGRMIMVHIGAIGADKAQDDWLRHQIGLVDETLYLTANADDMSGPLAIRRTMAAILRKATELGMISGRGVMPLRSQDQSCLTARTGFVFAP